MKYFWIGIMAFIWGIIDSCFFSIGSFNLLIGVITLAIFYSFNKSSYALVFAFTYGLILDLFLKSGIGFTSIILVLLTWIWFEIRDNVKINPIATRILIPATYIVFVLILIKFRFNVMAMKKVFGSIDIVFVVSMLVYVLIFAFAPKSNKSIGKI